MANAQITPDGSLPTTVEQLQGIMQIEGGERTGDNLFHSFEEFNIRVGEQAIFDNALDIQNIFARITGGETSTLDGLLKTQGGANLFFINPAGVVFGENAQLDVGGSFIATTADSVQFEDDTSLVAKDDNPNTSLTITIPVELNFGSKPGSIIVNGAGHQITSDSTLSPINIGETAGLSVKSGKTLALIANGVYFCGGIIRADKANIVIGSVESGRIGMSTLGDKLIFSFSTTQGFQDIKLNRQSLIALINSNDEQESIISLTGNNISLFDASFMLNQSTSNVKLAASIDIDAANLITLSGKSYDGLMFNQIRSEVIETGKMKGANINISAKSLIIEDAGKIQAVTFSDSVEGLGGDINLNCDLVELKSGLITTSTFSESDAGNLTLSYQSWRNNH